MQDPRSKQEQQIGEKDKANTNIRWPISDFLYFFSLIYLDLGSWILILVISSFKRTAI